MTDSGVGRSSDWATRIVGLDLELPLLDGRLARYINLDNAATTPPLRDVLDAVLRFLPCYSSVHRGAGLKSRISTAAYDEAHHTIARFVGANVDTNTVIFGKNTTEAINKLSYRYPLSKDAIVLSTLMEHHSNDLPWRRRARVVRATVTSDGRLDEDDLDRLLETYRGRVALVTVSGASNVTGFVQPVHRLARKAHAAAPGSWSTPRNWRPTVRSTSRRTTIRSTWTSSSCQLTRCTRRSAPERWLARKTSSCTASLNIKAEERWMS